MAMLDDACVMAGKNSVDYISIPQSSERRALDLISSPRHIACLIRTLCFFGYMHYARLESSFFIVEFLALSNIFFAYNLPIHAFLCRGHLHRRQPGHGQQVLRGVPQLLQLGEIFLRYTCIQVSQPARSFTHRIVPYVSGKKIFFTFPPPIQATVNAGICGEYGEEFQVKLNQYLHGLFYAEH